MTVEKIPLKIYFAGAIRGGRQDAGLYAGLIDYLDRHGRVLTEHVGNDALLEAENRMTEQEIFQRDLDWLQAADLVIAEVSTPSLGVGYEIGLAESLGKPIFCLYRQGSTSSLSAMIAGNPALQIFCYRSQQEARARIDQWLTPFTTIANQ